MTGGKRPGDRFTEATASANYLLERGVPDDEILREVQGTNSWESLAAAARILRERGLSEVILVSDPYHALRIGGIAVSSDSPRTFRLRAPAGCRAAAS